MQRVNIPEIGDVFTLARDWVFTLHDEYRNHDLAYGLGLSNDGDRWGDSDEHWSVKLPAGTQLRVDRIYIRKGASDYSSLTFHVVDTPLKTLTPVKKGGTFRGKRRRFWAKLNEVNYMFVQTGD